LLPIVSLAGASAPTAWAESDAANPRDCHLVLLNPNGAQAYCTRLGAGEQVRAEIRCDGFWYDYDRYGPWVSNVTASSIYCDKTADDRLDARWNVLQPV
jgi:hypothetical protein